MAQATPTARPIRRMLAASALALAAGCSGSGVDFDMRGLGGGFNTSDVTRDLPARPEPDARGIITYPNSQAAVARQGETVAQLAARLGLDAAELARFNGITPDSTLRRGELLVLPASAGTVTAPTSDLAAPGAVDVTDLASAAIDRADGGAPAPTPVRAEAPAPAAGAEPLRHQVQRGETVYSIARLYGVPARALADWNGLGPDLAIREGQQLLIPQAGGTAPAPATVAPAVATVPGAGSPTPLPPSSTAPLPQEQPPPASAAAVAEDAPPTPDLGAEREEPEDSGRLAMPVQGTIIREYARGRNEGIDIAAPAGTAVRAADSGTVAAITQDTDGASIVVLRHANNLLTVYVNITDLAVEKDQQVSRGQTIARIPPGDPSYLHFETREGLQSVDPANYLP
ncbi:peptidoglycan DD-metalloendopeptidase family protein [Histidinibacterium lentulum]|uniref:LysM peptidoglycan-binding domain-containing protein n=1 Tax=Histidinibacterium lentulum TaxID=2480588 RepID=A0A3N2QLR5_9RHOB|nr:peptidoglycan DD-metalloendopeptidase family protein [Histidinibacterium lentulum]ROT96139.1 LysM peptidoglycan-binding domain-containing protein [Histidinibacterium lentulum]